MGSNTNNDDDDDDMGMNPLVVSTGRQISSLEARILFEIDFQKIMTGLPRDKWPHIASTDVDLYQTLQLVMIKGGYENVIQMKLWLETAHQLMLPKSCTSLSLQIRQVYEKYLLNIEMAYQEQLVSQQAGDKFEPVDSSVKEEIENRDTVADALVGIAESLETSSRKKRKLERDASSMSTFKRAEGFFNYKDFIHDTSYQDSGAVACGFNAHAMMPPEIMAFPEFSYEASPQQRCKYIDIRNYILLMWISNPKVELSLQHDILNPLVAKYGKSEASEYFLDRHLIASVFHFLETCGAINHGVFEKFSPEITRRFLPGRSSVGGPKHIVVIGAGLSGLAAAKQLQFFGHRVTLLEGRERIGGRVLTDKSFDGAPVDLGAMLITGAVAHPGMLISKQLDEPNHLIKSECPLYWSNGKHHGAQIEEFTDTNVETKFIAASELAVTNKMELLKNQNVHVDVTPVDPEGDIPTCSITERKKILEWVKAPSDDTKDRLINFELIKPPEPTYPVPDPPEYHDIKNQIETMIPMVDKYSNDALEAASKVLDHLKTSFSERFYSEYKENVYSNTDENISMGVQRAQQAKEVVEKLSLEELFAPESERVFDVPLQTALDAVIQDLGTRERWQQFSDDDIAVLNWHMANLEYANSTTLKNVSNTNWDQDDEYSFAGTHHMLRNGFVVLAEGLARNMKIQFDSVVQSIKWSEPKVTVNYVQNYIEKFAECDAVLITVPLGVLKANTIRFIPSLPDWKDDCIKSLGFGNLNKVVVEFPYVFWDENKDVFGRVVSQEDDPRSWLPLPNDPHFSYEIRRGEFFNFWAVNRNVADNRPILIFIISGCAANNIEKIPDEKVVECLMHVLRGIYGHAPSPLRAVVTKWSQDPFARGSYSYISLGSSGKDYDTLAESVDDRLFFAGEATSREHPATIGGAYNSGIREACKIAGIFGRTLQLVDVSPDPNLFKQCWYSSASYEANLQPTEQYFEQVRIRLNTKRRKAKKPKDNSNKSKNSNNDEQPAKRLSVRQQRLRDRMQLEEAKQQEIDNTPAYKMKCLPIPERLVHLRMAKLRPSIVVKEMSHVPAENLEMLYSERGQLLKPL